jgi:DNA-binding MarR family transcriptional regulator
MDLTPVQAQALRLIRTDPVPTSQLAIALGISAPAVTQLTDRLGNKELIVRQTVQTDRRSVMIAITEKGGRAVDTFRRRRRETFSDLLLRLAAEERIEVIAALSKLAAVIPGHKATPVQKPGLTETARTGQLPRRTAVEAAEASKNVGQRPVMPTRRMKIEWD